MDWEKPLNAASHEERISKTIAWRGIMIANELNELQTEYRSITPETTLLFFGLFWVALGW
jgi:hypothetical protein